MERRLSAIVAADVVGYSRLVRMDEEATIKALRSLRKERVQPQIKAHGGRIVKLMGDGLLAEFPSVVDAVAFAGEMQSEVAALNVEPVSGMKLAFRVGVNLGDVIIDGDDIQGDGVNIAARLEALSEPGGMCIADSVHEQVRDRLDLVFEDCGEQEVKNIDRPVKAWKWLGPAATGSPGPKSVETRSAMPDKPSIAVLPFDNMSGDPEQEFFADGIAEDLTTSLSRLRWFFVIARNSAFVFKGQAVDVREVAGKLGVRYVVEGSVRKAGQRIRINVQLIDTVSGSHVWADRYDRDLTDIFEVQDEIVQNISAAIEPQLLAAEAIQSSSRTADNLDAWGLVVRARAHFWRMTQTESAKAIDLLRTAVAKDPGYGPAQSALSFAILFSIHMGWLPAGDGHQEATARARKALEIDDLDPWAYVSLGYLATVERDTDQGAAMFTRAVDLNPNFAAAVGWRSFCLAMGGRPDEAFADAELAIRLSPLDPQNAVFVGAKGVAHFVAGQYDEALVEIRKSLELRPDFIGMNRLHCTTLANLDRMDEARVAYGRYVELHPDASATLLRRILPYARKDDMDRFIGGLQMAGLPD